MKALISIIVPVYNASRYLGQCIESILNQTYQNLEIILIDDGSTDNSFQIGDRYQKADGRIKVIHRENGGLVAARKSGLEAANGDYIGFVDADDYIEPDMYEKLYAAIKEFYVDFVHSGMIVNHTKICACEDGVMDLTVCDRADYINKNIFEKQTMFSALWSKLFRADLVREAYGKLPDEQSYGEDLLCLCNCLLTCRSFYILPEAFYHYRIHEGSLSHLNWVDTCIEESKLYMQVTELLRENRLWDKCADSAKIRCKRGIVQRMTEDTFGWISILRYRFPNAEKLEGKKVAIYGAGTVGRDFYSQFSRMSQCEIIAWVDKQKYGIWNLIPIEKPEALTDIPYDALIIAVKDKTVADEIKKQLMQKEICKKDSVVLWEEPISIWDE